MSDPYAWWRGALVGKRLPLHGDEPVCGYFKMRDRRWANKDLAPVKRPIVPAAIWPNPDGSLSAEFAGESIPVGTIWPYCAKNPIPYEDYDHWHKHGCWPQEAA